MNQNARSFFEKYFAWNKFIHRAIECINHMMNRYDIGRMVQYFNGYYYTCNKFGHKANQ